MLIITEKPSVAKDFAKALACSFSASDQAYKSRDREITIVHCVGHLFNLQQPDFYDERFKYWNQLPIIPQQFAYDINPQTKDVAKNVIQHIKNHKNDEILIATDADREGEIIARECLLASRISDYSKIKRFWVSQALTPEVILEGIKNAKPSSLYDDIAEQGFARQKADWLVGMNFTRFMTNMSGVLLTAGRVQTAILSAINNRCESIENFKSEKYYEHFGNFSDNNGNECIGIFLDETENTSFPNPLEKLNNLSGKRASLISNKTEEKKINPPQLYNLNDLQKEAFRLYGFSAERTLQIVQKLYEEYKCVSYPRTPSKVMGKDNINLCKVTSSMLLSTYKSYNEAFENGNYTSSNKRVFDDSKLEAHHAIIPLEPLPYNTTIEEQSIYFLILERFFLAFGPAHIYEKQTVFLDVNGSRFKIIGRKIIDNGWKTFVTINTPEEKENILDSQ
ncbi:MAG: DNA topoisomerase, partial [Treponema sp.]|nr:DNA topoisomerase [Treponema sp.]